jgi:hypothetical protein
MFLSAKARNSSFGFSALAYVSAKTKCAVCAAGFSLQVTALAMISCVLIKFDIRLVVANVKKQ